ncbi:MAG: hypothetical protein WC285_03520 [Candidatus Gracilibacteria bacterium]|jgi:hypothetical protein
MQKKNLKMLGYAMIAVIALGAGVYYSMLTQVTNDHFLETSVLNVLKTVDKSFETDVPPDLAIEDVILEKVQNPGINFNYYKYKATLVVKNYGGTLVNAPVVLHGDTNQKYSFVRNTTKGFYLQKNGTYIIRDYDVLFDGNYNGGKITLTIDVKDKVDSNLANNSISTTVLELPPKIKDISLNGISDEKSFTVGFEKNPNFEKYNFEIVTKRQYDFPADQLKYAETSGSGHVYGYYRAPNNSDIVTSTDWQKITDLSKGDISVKFTEDPFSDVDEHYMYLKATNPETGYYVVSNIIKFPRYSALTYGDFAKIFADYTGNDVTNNAALYSEYNPAKTISRGEVLKTVLNTAKVNLATNSLDNHFQDVTVQDTLYPYAEALYDKGLWGTFGYRLNPEFPATSDYMEYLLYSFGL